MCATAINECDTHQICKNIYIKGCGGNEDGSTNPRSTTYAETSNDIQINIFPNPFNDFIEVACSDYKIGTRIRGRLISTDGNEIKSIEEYSHNFKVDMAELPSGLYVLQLNVDGMTFHEKIVKL